ncbi:MAG: putative toxin-antitoxin system toxin component, PIN family [Chloroflexota bacterium]|nr:putative toxin-antitoxin system toxin component, PIN family [Chloroflexota bacterium]
MRVLLDANLFISYLLNPDRDSPVTRVVKAGVGGEYTLLLPAALLEEFSRRISTKPYLAERIAPTDLEQLNAILSTVAEIIPKIKQPIPAVTRDPKDDYLLAYALVGQADYLVSGDQDLLELHRAGKCQIVNPRAFADEIDKPQI